MLFSVLFFLHYSSQYSHLLSFPDPSSCTILVWYSWLWSNALSHIVIRSFRVKCHKNLFLYTIPSTVFPRLCSRSSTLQHVHYFSQYSHLLLLFLNHAWWHSTLLFLSPIQFWLKYNLPSKCFKQVFSWMTAKLLTLNSCKTQFLIGLKKQLVKYRSRK